MNIVAEECKVKKHHPEWSNVRSALIMWYYHFSVANEVRDRYIIRRSSAGRRILPLGYRRKMYWWRGFVMSRLRFAESWRLNGTLLSRVMLGRGWRIGLRVKEKAVVCLKSLRYDSESFWTLLYEITWTWRDEDTCVCSLIILWRCNYVLIREATTKEGSNGCRCMVI